MVSQQQHWCTLGCKLLQGNCMTPPSPEALSLTGRPLLTDWKPGQCVIVTDVHLMYVAQNMWLDNLFIRHTKTERGGRPILATESESCNLWMTNVTLQGEGTMDPVWPVFVSDGQVYAEGMSLFD